MPKCCALLLLTFLCKYIFAQSPSYGRKILQDSISPSDSLMIGVARENLLDNIATVSLNDADLSDNSSQNISSLLTAGRDPFYSAASFNFSPARFRIRGYDADFSAAFMNGIPMNNLDNGYTPYSLWGGLNDVLRNKDVSTGLRNNTFGFGDIGTTTNIDSRSSKQRKQTSFSYARSNRSYTDKWAFTHSSGIGKKGWAFTVSASGRWAAEGYVSGTYYNGWSYFAGVDKRIGQKNLLSVVAFASPAEYARNSASTKEMMALANSHYYNAYWGYQNGKKRNAAVSSSNQPVIILTHDLRINNKTNLLTAAGYSFGERSSSSIDWYNAPDPRPDYYGYLPSYYNNDPYQKQQLQQLMQSDESLRQVNWQQLYDINRTNSETINDIDGIAGNTITGKRSLYILSDRVTNTKKFSLNSTLNKQISDHTNITAGVSFQIQKNNYYQRVADLLGGDFYVDLNQFAQRDYPDNANAYQNNLNDPNRILHNGDKYGYNYDIDINKAAGWLQAVFTFSKSDFFLAAEISQTQFRRVGNVRNGLFPDNSFGESATYIFSNYAVKSGITYKINGRNYLYLNTALLTRAPYFENVYESPRTRDFTQDKLTNESIQTAETGYVVNAPKLKIRLSGYYTKFKNGFNVLSFYDDQYGNFVNYALSNINKLNFGCELGTEATIIPNVSITAAASVGRYYYTSRQNATVTLDNNATVLDKEIVYVENYRIPSTPQEAYSFGIFYRSPKYWFLSLTENHFGQMWLSINPLRRTTEAVLGLDNKSAQYQNIVAQQELPAQYTLDFFGGYSWKLPKSFGFKKSVFLVINIGVNNLLNNQDIISGGYEQLRFDFENHDANKFPPKYYYAYGLNYYLSATIRF